MLWLVLSLTLGAAAPKPPLPIYVFTTVAPSGFVDDDQRSRTDRVRDLRSVLTRRLDRFTPIVVDSPDEAVVVIEVLSVRLDGEDIITARVSAGDYVTEMRNPESTGTWKLHAAHWQRRFSRWANANGPRLAELLQQQSAPATR